MGRRGDIGRPIRPAGGQEGGEEPPPGGARVSGGQRPRRLLLREESGEVEGGSGRERRYMVPRLRADADGGGEQENARGAGAGTLPGSPPLERTQEVREREGRALRGGELFSRGHNATGGGFRRKNDGRRGAADVFFRGWRAPPIFSDGPPAASADRGRGRGRRSGGLPRAASF
jgi:hypothetical protein